MATRADFYVGRGEDAEWLGSIAFDGYPGGIPDAIRQATTERAYRDAVLDMLRDDDSASGPDHGWPWPWSDSRTTDWAYAFDKDVTWASNWGYSWFPATHDDDPDDYEGPKKCVFPDMSRFKTFAPPGSPRSGTMVFVVPSADTPGADAE